MEQVSFSIFRDNRTFSLGVRPRREFYLRVLRIQGDDERIGSKCDVKLVKLVGGCAWLPHRIELVVYDRLACGYGFFGSRKDAVITALAFIHVVSIVINEYSKVWHRFSF